MNNEVYKEVYGHILNDAQRIRKEIMSEWGDILMFGGSMPEDVVNELSTAARITGLAFDALSNHDVAFEQVANKPDLFRLTVREESYVCHKSAIPSMSGFLDVVNVPGVPSSTFEHSSPVKEEAEEEVQEEETPKKQAKKKAPVVEEPEEPEFEEDPIPLKPWEDLEDDEDKVNDNDLEEEEEDSEEEIEYEDDDDEIPQASFEATDDDEEEESIQFEDGEETELEDDEDSESEEPEYESENEDEDSEDDEEEEVSYPSRKAEVIGGTAQVSSIAKRDLFIEEAQKNRDDFIYEMFQVSLTHSGYSGGGKPEELTIMIAPLKIQKFTSVSVPIIVSVYHKGKIISKSSYDQVEDGKNLVMLDINEFYLLFRGSFDANGEFKGFISTTGISANQGDILNIISNNSYGVKDSRTVNNGHIKIRSIVDDEEGTIEAFPFGEPEDNEFIVMTKNDEFVDYLYISDAVKGLKKAIIFQGGQKTQVMCSWDDDYEQMSLELKPL